MYRLMYSVFVLLMCVFVTNAFGVTAVSSTWEGSYEADYLPDVEIGMTWDGWGASSSTVSGGILSMTSYPGTGDDNGFWWQHAGNLSPALDYSTGVSLELRVKVIASESESAARLQVMDSAGDRLKFGMIDTAVSFPGYGSVAFVTTDAFHVYRVTAAPGVVNLYADTSSPILTMASYFSASTPNTMAFGDFTGPDINAEWELDYLRWTDAGAFPLPEPMSIGLLGLGCLFLRRRK